MYNRKKLLAILSLVVLISISPFARTQSRPVTGRYEREFVPARSNMKTMPNFEGRLKAHSNGLLNTAAMTTFKSPQLAFNGDDSSNTSWPQWGHDATHSGSINVTGQSLNKILAK